MRFVDIAHLTIENFRNRKSRAFLTVLGVAVAIAAVFSLVSFGYGLQKNLLERITTEESLLALDILPADSNLIQLGVATIQQIRKVEHVANVSPQATFNGELVLQGITAGTLVNIVEKTFFNLKGVKPIAGHFFNSDSGVKNGGVSGADREGSAKGEVVVTTAIGTLFNIPPTELLGKKLKLSLFIPKGVDTAETEINRLEEEFEIVGTVDSRSGGGEVFILSSTVGLFPITEYKSAKVVVDTNAHLAQVRDRLIELGFLVSALSDVVDQANQIFRIVQIALAIFGIIALVVAAIGLVNTMTIALLERTNEIGVMRAIGASPKDIRRIFLGESTLIGFFGGASGIAVGLIVSEALNWTFNVVAVSLGGSVNRLFAYPLWFSVFIIILSTVVGFVGGFWPANRASKMKPLQALKYK